MALNIGNSHPPNLTRNPPSSNARQTRPAYFLR
jgi:hypothetical protein